jgi:uncharacterized RmlC-like cupin family protein
MAKKTKYSQYFLTDFKEGANHAAVASPQAYFRGARQLPGATLNMGWQVFTKPIQLEKEAHTHDFDEYLVFLGAKLPDVFSSFKAEIDFYIGEELEYHPITKATIIFIPAGLTHCPLNFKKLDEPVLFHAILLSPRFTKKMAGKEYAYDGPNYGGAGPMIED